MLSRPPERRQGDNLQDDYSDMASIDCSTPDLARNEFKEEADINYLLSRFGFNIPQRAPVFGEFDQDLNLQLATDSIGAARAAWHRLPDELRTKYPHWTKLLYAISAGEVKSLDLKPKPEPTETEVTPATPTT